MKSILVIDDDQMRHMLTQMLERAGYEPLDNSPARCYDAENNKIV